MDVIKDRVEQIWTTFELLRMPSKSAQRMGFDREDAELLAECGLPEWAAPNMHFHYPRKKADGRILMGLDRERRPIFYVANFRRVEVLQRDGVYLLLARNIGDLLELLMGYAVMVDAAIIEHGSSAFTKNNIPAHLIAQFGDVVTRFIGSETSFWDDELKRLKSHSHDEHRS